MKQPDKAVPDMKHYEQQKRTQFDAGMFQTQSEPRRALFAVQQPDKAVPVLCKLGHFPFEDLKHHFSISKMMS
jgi:hypothetical protein